MLATSFGLIASFGVAKKSCAASLSKCRTRTTLALVVCMTSSTQHGRRTGSNSSAIHAALSPTPQKGFKHKVRSMERRRESMPFAKTAASLGANNL